MKKTIALNSIIPEKDRAELEAFLSSINPQAQARLEPMPSYTLLFLNGDSLDLQKTYQFLTARGYPIKNQYCAQNLLCSAEWYIRKQSGR